MPILKVKNEDGTWSEIGLAGGASSGGSVNVDSALSTTSTNPVQNRVATNAINELAELIGDKSVSQQIDEALKDVNINVDTSAINVQIDELREVISNKADVDHTHDSVYDAFGSASSALGSANEYTDDSVAELERLVGSLPEGTSATSVVDYVDIKTAGVSTDVALEELQLQLKNKADKSHNHDDQYYTESEINALLESKADKTHNYDDKYDAKGSASNALDSAKVYADEAADKVKNDLLNGAGDAYDTLKELGDLIEDNTDAIDALRDIASGKADETHSHTIADVIDLQSALNNKADSSHFDAHIDTEGLHVTSGDRTNWGTAYTHSQSPHAPSDAQVNIIEGIKVNGTVQAISNKVVNITVPTDNKDLSNGAGYLVSSDIANKANKATTLSGYGITDAYTKTQIDTTLSGKSDSGHHHNDTYYTESEIDNKIDNLNISIDGKATKATTLSGYGITDAESKGAANTALATAKEYTDTKTSGLASTSSVNTSISTHNTSTAAHNDIRDLISGLTTRLNTLANSDDTTLDQMSEVVAYIKNNKNLIDGITTSKVNVSDIINNLTTNVSNKPLSAAQGVAIKALIDAIVVPTKVSQLENDKSYLTSYIETDPTVPTWAKADTKPTYTASEVGALPTSGGTISGDLGINGKVIQGSPSTDSTVESMNRFQSDLFVEGNGSAPNNPNVAGFYLGKSATDENRHMDIVSGGEFSYIDFNKADRGTDYDARILVNVENGNTQFMWGTSEELTQKIFNVQGAIQQYGSPVALQSAIPVQASDIGAYTKAEVDNTVSSLQSSINGKADIGHTHETAEGGLAKEYRK